MNALAIVFLLAHGIALAPRKLTNLPQITVRCIAADASEARHLSNIQGHIRAAHEQIAEFRADFFRFLLEKTAARFVLSKPGRDDVSFSLPASVRHTDTGYLTADGPQSLRTSASRWPSLKVEGLPGERLEFDRRGSLV
jgi:hypothetical protein